MGLAFDPIYAYTYFVRHIIPGPQSLSYLVTHILLPVALLIPRSVLSRWQSVAVFIPVMMGCTIHAWTVMGGVDVPSLDTLLWAIFLLVLKDPWTEFALLTPRPDNDRKADEDDRPHGDDKTQNGHAKPPQITTISGHTTHHYPSNLPARIPWVAKLIANFPLDSWLISHQPHDSLQPPSPAFKSPSAFILHTTFHAAIAYLTLDLTCALTTKDPYFTNHNIPLSSPLPTNLPLHPCFLTIPPAILRAATISLQANALIACLLPVPALLPALLHILNFAPTSWSPHSWPAYFGSPRAFLENGLSGWWGSYWHQTMRWAVAGPGMALSDSLGLERRGLARRAIVLMSAFGLSGCVHMGLFPPEPLHLGVGGSVTRVRLCVAGFFWVQAVGVWWEDVVWRVVGKKRGREGVWWWVRAGFNVAWLFAWFCACMPLLGEAGRQLGWWRHWLVPVSLWRGMRGEEWVAWEVLRD